MRNRSKVLITDNYGTTKTQLQEVGARKKSTLFVRVFYQPVPNSTKINEKPSVAKSE